MRTDGDMQNFFASLGLKKEISDSGSNTKMSCRIIPQRPGYRIHYPWGWKELMGLAIALISISSST